MTMIREPEEALNTPVIFQFTGCADLKLRVDAAKVLGGADVQVRINGTALHAKAVKSGRRKRLVPTGVELTGATLQKISTKWLLVTDAKGPIWVTALTAETTITITKTPTDNLKR